MPALEAELDLPSKAVHRFRGAVHFDFGVIPGGYAWLFPKQKGISAGILSRGRPARKLRPHLMRYLVRNGLPGEGGRLRSLRLHPIPYRPHRRNRYAEDRGLVVGDAAGLVDPVTGEGIFYALRSAQIAARILTHGGRRRHTLSERYNDAVKGEIEAEVLKADFLARILYGCPPLSNWVLARCGAKIGPKHLAVYLGEMRYRQLFRYVMSPRGVGYLLRPHPRKDA
jgi:flavin-dependent dehydrogenase